MEGEQGKFGKPEPGKSEREDATPASKSAESKPEASKPKEPKPADRRKLLRAGLVALVVVVALVAWLATRDSGNGDSSSTTSTPTTTTTAKAVPPRIVSPAQLGQVAASGNPVYWVGVVPGTELELSELAGGGAQVRYLPAGTKAGEGSANAVTIGSYPLPDPSASLQGYAKRPGATVRHGPNGLEVVTSSQRPTSVYFASLDNKVQVEVYAPSPQRALGLALSGRVQPVG